MAGAPRRHHKEREGQDVTIEVLSRDFGDELEARRLPLAYLAYDAKDDVGGHAARYRDRRRRRRPDVRHPPPEVNRSPETPHRWTRPFQAASRGRVAERIAIAQSSASSPSVMAASAPVRTKP